MHTDVYVCMLVYVCICMHVYVCMYMYVYVCMYMYVYVCVYVCVYMYVCMYACMCMSVYAYVYMYVCIIYWGIVRGKCPPQNERGIVRGKLSGRIVLHSRPVRPLLNFRGNRKWAFPVLFSKQKLICSHPPLLLFHVRGGRQEPFISATK